MSSLSSFDIISVAVPDPNIFLCTPEFAADAAAVNCNGIKTLLANEFSLMVVLFLIMDQEVD